MSLNYPEDGANRWLRRRRGASRRTSIRRIVATAFMQFWGVLITAGTGMLIVNLVPKGEYAQYVFLMSLMTLFLGVSDLGLSSTTLPVIGSRSHENYWVKAVCVRVFGWRWVLAAIALVPMMLYWMFVVQLQAWASPAFISSSLLLIVVVGLTLEVNRSTAILTVQQRVTVLGRLFVGFTLGRAMLLSSALAASLWFSWSFLLPVLCALTLSALFAAIACQRLVGSTRVQLTKSDKRKIDRRAWGVARPLILPSLYIQFQGVITIFLASVFSSAGVVAELGALGRLAALLVLVERLAALLFLPYLARQPEGSGFVGAVAISQGIFWLVSLMLSVSAVLLPQAWLFVLGSEYADLTSVVWILVASALMTTGASLTLQTLVSRGRTRGQSMRLIPILLFQISFVALADFSSLFNLLLFNLLSSALGAAMQVLFLLRFLTQERRKSASLSTLM